MKVRFFTTLNTLREKIFHREQEQIQKIASKACNFSSIQIEEGKALEKSAYPHLGSK